MRIKVDRENDALYFRLDEKRIVESEEVRPGSDSRLRRKRSRWSGWSFSEPPRGQRGGTLEPAISDSVRHIVGRGTAAAGCSRRKAVKRGCWPCQCPGWVDVAFLSRIEMGDWCLTEPAPENSRANRRRSTWHVRVLHAYSLFIQSGTSNVQSGTAFGSGNFSFSHSLHKLPEVLHLLEGHVEHHDDRS